MKRALNSLLVFFLLFLAIDTLQLAIAKDFEGAGFISCSAEAGAPKVNCDFLYPSGIAVKDLTLTIGGSPHQIPENGVSAYPSEGQRSDILFLVDVSDPSRINTIQNRNRQHIVEMLLKQKEYEKIGVAVFDSEITFLSPLGSTQEENIKAVNSIRAKGQATEFYKNILAAIQILKKAGATRKGLVLISDGKDEDRAYKSEDVIRAANDANVVILGLGYSERASDAPYLQTIKRLTDSTNGQFVNVSGDKLPSNFLNNPFEFLEKGGRISFDSNKFYGINELVLTLGLQDGSSVALKTKFDFPDRRNIFLKVVDLLKRHWVLTFLFLLIIIPCSYFVSKLLAKRKSFVAGKAIYAYLHEYDGSGTQYEIRKTAICIGRSQDNDICLTNDSISSHHAEIHRRRDGSFYIVDLASTNGIIVNDKKISQVELVDGDVIELGEVRLNFSVNRLM